MGRLTSAMRHSGKQIRTGTYCAKSESVVPAAGFLWAGMESKITGNMTGSRTPRTKPALAESHDGDDRPGATHGDVLRSVLARHLECAHDCQASARHDTLLWRQLALTSAVRRAA
jgi:hypothetical protein